MGGEKSQFAEDVDSLFMTVGEDSTAEEVPPTEPDNEIPEEEEKST